MSGATLTLDKASLIDQAKHAMQTHLQGAAYSLVQKVALCCRILSAHGHDSGLAGQITARGAGPGEFYTQQFGLGFDEIAPDNLLLVDRDLTVIGGQGMANPANRFHTWIYQARPDIGCIIHTHPIHVSALSTLGQPLKVAHMDSCMLYEDVAFLSHWPGVPVGNDEGALIAGALGDKRAVLLAHHGLVVAGRTIEEACVFAVQCERTARLHLLAQAAGTIKDIPPDLAREAHDWILQEKRSAASFAYFARRLLRDLSPEEAVRLVG